MQFKLYDVFGDGKKADTNKTIELTSIDEKSSIIVKKIFTLYGFVEYANFYLSRKQDGGIYISYNYPNDGTKDTWFLEPVKSITPPK